jgi:hypothetical protein
MPYVYTPIVLITLAGVLIIVGALMGPETRDVEMRAVDLGVVGPHLAPIEAPS